MRIHAPIPRLAAVAVVAAVGLTGCGSGPLRKPPQPQVVAAGSSKGAKPDTSNPSASLMSCLKKRNVAARPAGPDTVAIDPPGRGLRVTFLGTDGDAQAAQLQGRSEGSEVILNALLHVGTASDVQIRPVEKCTEKAAK